MPIEECDGRRSDERDPLIRRAEDHVIAHGASRCRLRDRSRIVRAQLGEPGASVEEARVEKVRAGAARLEGELAEAQDLTVEAELEEGLAPPRASSARRHLRIGLHLGGVEPRTKGACGFKRGAWLLKERGTLVAGWRVCVGGVVGARVCASVRLVSRRAHAERHLGVRGLGYGDRTEFADLLLQESVTPSDFKMRSGAHLSKKKRKKSSPHFERPNR